MRKTPFQIKQRQRVKFFDEDFNETEGEVIQRLGDMTLVIDDNTGRPIWVADFEIKEITDALQAA